MARRKLPLGYQPNIIFVNMDDAPLDTYESGLPQLNAVANALKYVNGGCDGPLCLPGRIAPLTGQVMEHHHGWDNSSGANLRLGETVLVALRAAGYFTGAVGKWINGFLEDGQGGFGDEERQPGIDFQRIFAAAPNYTHYTILYEDGRTVAYGGVASDAEHEAGETHSHDGNYATDRELDDIIGRALLSVQYVGIAATASLAIVNGVLTVTAGGSVLTTFTFASIVDGQGNPTVQALVTAIDAHADLTAAVLGSNGSRSTLTIDPVKAGTPCKAAAVSLGVKGFLPSVPRGRRFFLYAATKAPHRDPGGPIPPPRHENTDITITANPAFGLLPSAYGNPPWMDESAESPWNQGAINDADEEHLKALRALLAVDENLAAIRQYLVANGLDGNTIWIIKTDNAHAYGELRQADKGTPHRSASSMLLRVYVPGNAGGIRRQPVSDIDIAPTICALAGAHMPVAPDGRSFHHTFDDADAPHRWGLIMGSRFKDSPTFNAVWKAADAANPWGTVYYEGLPGGKAAGQSGGWRDEHQIVDIGPQPDIAIGMHKLFESLY